MVHMDKHGNRLVTVATNRLSLVLAFLMLVMTWTPMLVWELYNTQFAFMGGLLAGCSLCYLLFELMIRHKNHQRCVQARN